MSLTFATRRFISYYYEIAIQLFIKTIILTIYKKYKFRVNLELLKHKGKIHLTFLWHIIYRKNGYDYCQQQKTTLIKDIIKNMTKQNKTKQNILNESP